MHNFTYTDCPTEVGWMALIVLELNKNLCELKIEIFLSCQMDSIRKVESIEMDSASKVESIEMDFLSKVESVSMDSKSCWIHGAEW
jgi:hypothetical protein